MKYGYADAVNVLCEFPTENARRILPSHLTPLEPHHGLSVFSMIAFDFTDSVVGSYREVVMSVAIAPLVEPGLPVPRVSFFPYLVATTTESSRQHAIDTWHLPHWMEDVEIEFDAGDGTLTASVGVGGAPVARMTVHQHRWERVAHDYQGCIQDDAGSWIAKILMEGLASEHENEQGSLELHDHDFNVLLDVEDVCEVPFREMWMRHGQQTFAPLARDLRVTESPGNLADRA